MTMNKKYTALFLVLLAAACEANSVNLLKGWQTLKQLHTGRNFDKGITANVNDYVDDTIAMVVPFIQQNGLDPMQLPEVEEGFQVRPFWITYSAWLRLYDGHMTGLVNVARSGDQKLSYFSRMMRVRVQLQFTNLEFIYKYLVQLMGIGPKGVINGSLDRFVIVFDLLLDFNNDEIELQDFKLTDIGNLRVRLTGNWLTDWLVNPIVSVFMRIFNSNILNAVQSNIKSQIQNSIGGINKSMKEIIERLESYNRV